MPLPGVQRPISGDHAFRQHLCLPSLVTERAATHRSDPELSRSLA
jgi:hypothetical protein